MKGRKVLIIFMGITLLFLTLNLEATWTSKRLTWNSADEEFPAIAIDKNNHIHIIYNTNREYDYYADSELYYKKSTDGGDSWITKRLTWTSGDSRFADIAVDSNQNIHVVWQDKTPGNYEIYYKKSTDGGNSWITKKLTWTSGDSQFADIAVDSNQNIHVVWQDKTPGNNEIFYKKSTDGGDSWITKRLTWNSGDSESADVCIDSCQNIHVVWQDNSSGKKAILYKKNLSDETDVWLLQRLTWSYFCENPKIVIDSSDHVHVVWQKVIFIEDYDIFYRNSTNKGESWVTKTERLCWTSKESEYPAIAVDSNKYIHVVWQDRTVSTLYPDLFYKKGTDDGASWYPRERLTWSDYDSKTPAIAVDSSNHIYIVWIDTIYGIGREVFLKN